jgi:CRP-like cAMP-binding protein
MSVTPKLSREFYERLGKTAANELVGLLDHMYSVNRAELQQLNETNFVRFDARLEQRVTQLEARLEQRVGELRAYVDQRFAELSTTLERGLKEQTRWMFVAWASLLIPIIGLWMRG